MGADRGYRFVAQGGAELLDERGEDGVQLLAQRLQPHGVRALVEGTFQLTRCCLHQRHPQVRGDALDGVCRAFGRGLIAGS